MKVDSGRMDQAGRVEEGEEEEEEEEAGEEGVMGVLQVMKGVLGMGWPTRGQSAQYGGGSTDIVGWGGDGVEGRARGRLQPAPALNLR